MDADTLWNNTWTTLEKASSDKNHDFNTAVIGSYNEKLGTDLRTVVLRKAIPESQELWFYTDNRSDKMRELNLSHKTSWLFYDKHKKIQLRFYGESNACMLTDETLEIWNNLSFNGKLAYLAEPGPGTSTVKPNDGLDNVNDCEDATKKGYAHFTIIKTSVFKLDWLQLAAEGHRRIGYQRDGNKWLSDWLIP